MEREWAPAAVTCPPEHGTVAGGEAVSRGVGPSGCLEAALCPVLVGLGGLGLSLLSLP